MIPIESITEQNLIDRFDALPESLQETLVSPEKGHAVQEICTANHLTDEEKILTVRQVIAFIVMGYAHSYDLARELNETLELNNPKLASALADEIQAKIFAPIKADVDKNYRPLVPEKKGPVSVTEIKRPPVKFSVTPGASSPDENRPEPIRIITEVQGPPSLKKMEFAPPVPKPQISPGGIPKPSAPPIPAAPSPVLNTPPAQQEKLKVAPILLHEESEAAPAKRTPDYAQKPVDQIGAASKFFAAQEGKPLPPKPARFGTGFEEKIPGSESSPRVVHYTETKSDFSRGQFPPPTKKTPEIPPKPPATVPPPPLSKTWVESPPPAAKLGPEKPGEKPPILPPPPEMKPQ